MTGCSSDDESRSRRTPVRGAETDAPSVPYRHAGRAVRCSVVRAVVVARGESDSPWSGLSLSDRDAEGWLRRSVRVGSACAVTRRTRRAGRARLSPGPEGRLLDIAGRVARLRLVCTGITFAIAVCPGRGLAPRFRGRSARGRAGRVRFCSGTRVPMRCSPSSVCSGTGSRSRGCWTRSREGA